MLDFETCFEKLTGNPPFHWQRHMFERLRDGVFPRDCDVPTGLGKTSIIAIWLLALADALLRPKEQRRIPLRLVYVVDRRVIVDQSTDEAMKFIGELEKAEQEESVQSDNPLCLPAKVLRDVAFVKDGPIIALSSLRGQKAEDREWCLDPSRPAIVIGTVDMIGSRLLFSGYGGIGRSHRSLQAGLLGQDTLVLVDEAHLSPTFVGTLREIRNAIHRFKLIRPFEVIPLSATVLSEPDMESRTRQVVPLFDEIRELENPEAKRRLKAEKHIEWLYFDQPRNGKKKPTSKEIREAEATCMFERAVQYEGRPVSVVIFVSTVELVNMIAEKFMRRFGKEVVAERVQKMTGEMRGFERDGMTETPKFKMFFPDRVREAQDSTFYLIATSCAEVGVNLDGDQGVCDLTSLDGMIQRNGRINRFGRTMSTVTVVVDGLGIEATRSDVECERRHEAQIKDADREIEEIGKQVEWESGTVQTEAAKRSVKVARERLKHAEARKKRLEKDGVAYDHDPAVERVERVKYFTWLALKSRENEAGKVDASPSALRGLHDPQAWPPSPVRPHLDSARLDDWSMTSLKQTEFPRPLAAYWLHGVTADENIQTTLCWRADLSRAASAEQAEEMVRTMPPTPRERAVCSTFRVEETLGKLAKHFPDKLVVVIDAGGEYKAMSLSDLTKRKNGLFEVLAEATVVLPNTIGGLEEGHLLTNPPKNPRPVSDVANPSELARYVVKKRRDGDFEYAELLPNGTSGPMEICSDLKQTIGRCAEKSRRSEKNSQWVCVNWKHLEKAFADSEDESEAGGAGEPREIEMVAYFQNFKTPSVFLREDDDLASLGYDRERGRTVDEHDADVERYARGIARKIGLDEELGDVLALAGLGHDRGKNRAWWQSAIGNPNNAPDWKPLAKSLRNTFDHGLNQNYRHEFGSLVEVEADEALKSHPHRDLILHLIAAHHGYARPHFRTEGYDRSRPTALNRKTAEAATLRFAALQRKYGWWQLAYLEAVLKAADALASRDFNRGEL